MVGDEAKYDSQEGKLLVITGPMFAGKSEELLREITRITYTEQPFLVVKPDIDGRYSENDIVTHNGRKIPALKLKVGNETWEELDRLSEGKLKKAVYIGFDEGQFFSQKLVDLCLQLIDDGKKVIVAGLDTDYKRRPFGPMPNLMAHADEVRKLKAVCSKCKKREATLTYRKTAKGPQVVIGGKELYEARCKLCYRLPEEDSKGE